jgi:hypothetical protein
LIKKIFGDHAFKYRSKRTQSSSNGGGTSNGGANLFRIHLLEGHLGTKFMSCLSIIIREGSNKGVAETKERYSNTEECCILAIRLSSILLQVCYHFLQSGPGEIINTITKSTLVKEKLNGLVSMSLIVLNQAIQIILRNYRHQTNNHNRTNIIENEKKRKSIVLSELIDLNLSKVIVALLAHASASDTILQHNTTTISALGVEMKTSSKSTSTFKI